MPEEISQMLMEELDKEGLATESARVLHHPMAKTHINGEKPRGPNMGENPGFVTGKGWNDYNYNEDGTVKMITNPFSGEVEKSEDRGLFRINNATFYDYMKRMPDRLKKEGIASYEDMYDPILNTRMAKIIYEFQGWRAWFAAPKELRQ